jgi:hypothetical protein
MDSNDSEEKGGKNEVDLRGKALSYQNYQNLLARMIMPPHHGAGLTPSHEIWEALDDWYSKITIQLQGDNTNTNNLGLIFNLAEYDADEIAEIISLLSSLYQSVGGDALEIKTMGVYELTSKNILELV